MGFLNITHCLLPKRKKLYGLAIETNNFAFEVNVISGLESTHPEGYEAKIGLIGP